MKLDKEINYALAFITLEKERIAQSFVEREICKKKHQESLTINIENCIKELIYKWYCKRIFYKALYKVSRFHRDGFENIYKVVIEIRTNLLFVDYVCANIGLHKVEGLVVEIESYGSKNI